MRSTLVVCLAVLLIGNLTNAADPPIPQDPAKQEAAHRERLEWNRKTMGGAYEKIGKKDPRWDKAAHEAFDLAARTFSEVADPEVPLRDVYKPAKAAVDAGCDDPYLLYLYSRSGTGTAFSAEESLQRTQESVKSLVASRYPVFRRAIGLQVTGTLTLNSASPTPASRKEGQRSLDSCLALLSESVRSDERNVFWEDRWFDALIKLIEGYRSLGLEPLAAFGKIDAKLAKIPELKIFRLQVDARFRIDYAAELRTIQFADQLNEAQIAGFEKYSKQARAKLEEAWRLQPGNARTADYRLGLERGLGGDRATMELWFDRAMKADGDRYNACVMKLDWLDPKWHGSSEEMLAFGRACKATNNWWTGIILLAADAHVRQYDALPADQRTKYISSPEVFADIQSVYVEYLKHRGLDKLQRSRYAVLCYQAQKYPEAHAQFQILGDDLTAIPGSPTTVDLMKQMRDYTAKRVAAAGGK